MGPNDEFLVTHNEGNNRVITILDGKVGYEELDGKIYADLSLDQARELMNMGFTVKLTERPEPVLKPTPSEPEQDVGLSL